MSNRTGIKYPGATTSISKVHINNMYIKYTFVHFSILLIHQVSRAVPLPVTISFAVEALSFRLGSSFGLLHGCGNLLAILLEVPFFPLPFYLKLVVLSTINTWCFSWFLPSPNISIAKSSGNRFHHALHIIVHHEVLVKLGDSDWRTLSITILSGRLTPTWFTRL